MISTIGLNRLARPHIPHLAASLLLLTLHAMTTGAYAYLVGPLLKFIYSGGESAGSRVTGTLAWLGWNPGDAPTKLTAAMAVIIVALVVAKGVTFFSGTYLVVLAGQRLEHQLRSDLHHHLLHVAYARLSELPRGDMVSRFIHDVAAVKYAVTHGLTNIIRDALQVVVLAGLALYLDPVLGVITLGVLPLSTAVILRLGQKLRRRRRQAFDAYGDLGGSAVQTAAALPVLRAFRVEDRAHGRFTELSSRILRRNLRAWSLQIFTSPLMELLGALALAATLWYAGTRISSGALEPEEFVSFFAAVFMLYRPVKAIGEATSQVYGGLAALDRVNQILSLPTEPPEPPEAVDLSEITREIRFEAVRFSYGGDPVLREVSFTVEAGQTVAIVGGSGAGKTTLALLLLRLLEPERGRITIDGRELTTIRRASLRRIFALVTQDPVLLHDTIAANITFGLDRSIEQIEAAARTAGAHEFISALDEGYGTSVGESGSRLSGGERQRICLARAVLRDPPALLLDEATAAVDSATESEINRALEELMRGRTTLLISHRLSTVRRADRIVVLDRGRVAAQGTYQELLRDSELFRQIFRDQLESSREEKGDREGGE